MGFELQAVASNGCAAVLLITLLLNYQRKHNAKTEDSRLFVQMIISNLLQCIVEPATIVIDGKLFPGAVPLSIVLNAFLYMNNINFALLWALYADARSRSRKREKSVWGYWKFIPALLIVAGSAVNLFTPVFFRITDDNVYQRMDTFFIPYILTYFYMLMGTFSVFINREHKEKAMFMPALIFLFPVFTASIIQYCMPGISLLWSGAAIGLASVYMNLQDQSAFTDKLSGLFSRHYLNQYLSTLPERVKDSPLVLGIMMDVDDFKAINDTYGHLMGDDAIAAVGNILRAAIPNNRYLFRYAGDEFVVIMPIETPSEARPVISRIRYEIQRFNRTGGRPYTLELSMGYTTYIPGENPNAFIDRMDADMYQNKRLNKATKKG